MRIKIALITLFVFLFTLVSPFFAKAATLHVTSIPKVGQIPGSGTVDITITVINPTTNNAVAGAVVALSAVAPNPNCSGGGVASVTAAANTGFDGKTTVTFTGPATTSTNPAYVCKVEFTATAGGDMGISTATVIVGNGYVPSVSIPGIGIPTSFSSYLIGLYKFALSVVGIFALIMIMYAGIRYMTSAGNPAAMGDAKDAIYNAILGLALALLSWLIITTINPELTMIKKPLMGYTNPAMSGTLDRNVCAINNANDNTTTTCRCIDGATIQKMVPTATCNEACSWYSVPAEKTIISNDGRYHGTKTILYDGIDQYNVNNKKPLQIKAGQWVYFSLRDSYDCNPYYTNADPPNGIYRYEIDYGDGGMGGCSVAAMIPDSFDNTWCRILGITDLLYPLVAGDTCKNSGGTPSHQYNTPGTYIVRAGTYNNDCSFCGGLFSPICNTDTVTIEVFP